MRNLINYYYQLEPNDIRQIKNFYLFHVGRDQYKIQEIYDMDAHSSYELTKELYQMGIYTHQIIQTITGELVVTFNQKRYVLLKYVEGMDETVKLEEITSFQDHLMYIDITKAMNTSNWGELWSKKNDYFEYQMNQFGVKYPIIRNSFAYYIGLAEAGIALFYTYKSENIPLYLAHKRLKKDSTRYDLYDPFNLIVDVRVRDSAEYFKSRYLEENDIFLEIKTYLEEENLTEEEKLMFFIRMFYPSFYFDRYEEIMDNQLDDHLLEDTIKKSNHYDLLLKEIYNYLLEEIHLPYISWLRN